MSRKADPDITKLPKWAQERISNLERDLAYERKRFNPEHDPATSLVLADPYADPPLALRDDTMIEFYPHGRDQRDEYVQVRIEGRPDFGTGALIVRTGGNMRLAPEAQEDPQAPRQHQRRHG
jgi:hypothetical protein